MPTFLMHRGSHITVYVFHPLAFEALTLDPGTAQAFEASDQASALVQAAGPIAKGAVLGTVASELTVDRGRNASFTMMMRESVSRLGMAPNPPDDVKLAQEILSEIQDLNDLLTQALAPVWEYVDSTQIIYSQIREIESAMPRPVADSQNHPLRGLGVPADTPNPWDEFPAWQTYMRAEIVRQGNTTSVLLGRLPGPCQKSSDPKPVPGPWLAPARPCKSDPPVTATQESDNPIAIPDGFDALYETLTANLGRLGPGRPDPDTYKRIQDLKNQLDQRKDRISQMIVAVNELLPGFMTKISTDMQTLLANISLVRVTPSNPIRLGVIPSPPSADHPKPEERVLVPYKALAPQITYTVNAQNQIANPLLALPAAAQKQPIVTVTVLYASPRFEISAGTFLSWLPNHTFANVTDIAVTNGVPAPADIKIGMTTTTAPLVIPFVAANYRISPEFTWLGGRRGAVYATAGVSLDPYNTQVEYAAGLSVSWRFLMLSPLFHLGRPLHLTQGEQVGQTWCKYDNGATSSSTPPACAGSPPAPSTKNYWRGAFAIGISVRVPTTFSSSNR